MMFIDRNSGSRIVALYGAKQREGQEFVESASLWVDPTQVTLAEIIRLDREQMLPRITREFMLGTIETQFTPLQRGANFAYISLKAFDNQIAALRALL